MVLLDYLVQKLPEVKRTTLKRMVMSRRVTINGRIAEKLKQAITETDKIEIFDQPQEYPDVRPKLKPLPKRKKAAGPAEPVVVHEDDDILVVAKPAGLLTSTTAREKRPTLAAMLKQYVESRQKGAHLGIIHRLDRDASGLLVFSKHHEAYRHLKEQFYRHTVDRIYTAVVENIPSPKSGRIESFLYELPDGRVVTVRTEGKGQIAITDFQTLRTFKRSKDDLAAETEALTTPGRKWQPALHYSLVRVQLETGRKHQIRAHLAERKTPIVGDPMYGPTKHPLTRLLLAATHLAFNHPRTDQRVSFDLEPPDEIKALFPETDSALPNPTDAHRAAVRENKKAK